MATSAMVLSLHENSGIECRQQSLVLRFDNSRFLREVLGRHTNRPIDLSVDVSEDDTSSWDDILPDITPPTILLIETLRITGTTQQLSPIKELITQLTRNNGTREVFVELTISEDLSNNDFLEMDVNSLLEVLDRVNSAKINFLHPSCSSETMLRLGMNLPINAVPFLQFVSKCKMALVSYPECRGYEYERVNDVRVISLNLCQCSSRGCE